MDKNDGGPAFPWTETRLSLRSDEQKATIEKFQGMTLRDYFAAAALQGILAGVSNDATAFIPHCTDGSQIDRSIYARTAFGYADAMLAERNK